MINEIYNRTEILLGSDNIEKLKQSKVAILGLGGVGSYSLEALARVGIGEITIVDYDNVEKSNINRQISALHSTLNRRKTEVSRDRIEDINPGIKINVHNAFISKNNIHSLLNNELDYVVDAIDTVSSKLDIITFCKENNIKIISSMGTGNRIFSDKFKIRDISQTSYCPLAKVIRKELKNRNIYEDVKVLFYEGPPQIKTNDIIGSISYVPAIAGLKIAEEIIKDILGLDKL